MPPQRTVIAMGLARCHMIHRLKKKKGVTLSLKQGKIFPHKAITMAQAVKVSYLLVRKCSRFKALSGQAWGGETDHAVTVFPTMDPNVKPKTIKLSIKSKTESSGSRAKLRFITLDTKNVIYKRKN